MSIYLFSPIPLYTIESTVPSTNVDFSCQMVILMRNTVVQCLSDNPWVILRYWGWKQSAVRHIFERYFSDPLEKRIGGQEQWQTEMLSTDGPVCSIMKNPTDFDISRGQEMCRFITAKQQQRGMGYMALFRDAGFI